MLTRLTGRLVLPLSARADLIDGGVAMTTGSAGLDDESRRVVRRGLLHVLRNDVRGGLELSTLEVARYLASQGVAQSLLLLRAAEPGGISAAFAELGIPVVCLPFRKKTALSFALRFWLLLLRLRPEALLVSGSLGLHGPLCWLAWLAGVPRRYLYLVMGPTGGRAGTFWQWTMTQLARPVVTRALAVSASLKAQFVQRRWLPASAIVTRYRWRRVELIRARAQSARAARPLAAPGAWVLLTVSRLDPVKNLDGLMQDLVPFLRRHPAAVWRLAGEGPMLERLESLSGQLGIRGQVEFLHYQQAVPELLGQADVLLFTTTAIEGVGNVMIEAMAAGVPVLATDAAACREVLDQGRAGMLMATGAEPGVSAQLEALLADARGRSALVARASQHVQQFSDAVQGPLLLATLFPEHREGRALRSLEAD